MSKTVEIFRDEYGFISRYEIPNGKKPTVRRTAYTFAREVAQLGLRSGLYGVVHEVDGTEKSATVDNRGNVMMSPHFRELFRSRLNVGWGNVFDVGARIKGANKPPKRDRHCVLIGSGNVVGAGVILNSEYGVRLADGCRIGSGTTVSEGLDMRSDADVGSNVTANSLYIGLTSSIGDDSQIHDMVIGDMVQLDDSTMASGYVEVQRNFILGSDGVTFAELDVISRTARAMGPDIAGSRFQVVHQSF